MVEVTCVNCSKIFTGKTRAAMFCSPNCNSSMQRKRKAALWRHNRPCGYCGKVFLPFTSKNRFCSLKCKSLGQEPSHVNICENCAEQFKTFGVSQRFCSLSCSVSYTSRHLHKLVTCTMCGDSFQFTGRTTPKYCSECRVLVQRAAVSKHRVKIGAIKNPGIGSGHCQWGKDNHSWLPPERRKAVKTPYVGNYRLRCFKHWNRLCVICGSRDKLHVHHIDGNPSNFKTSNLIPVCDKHHYSLHYRRRNYSVTDRITRLFDLWPEGPCRIKMAELSGNAPKGVTRTEGLSEDSPGATHTGRERSSISRHEAATPRGENIC